MMWFWAKRAAPCDSEINSCVKVVYAIYGVRVGHSLHGVAVIQVPIVQKQIIECLVIAVNEQPEVELVLAEQRQLKRTANSCLFGFNSLHVIASNLHSDENNLYDLRDEFDRFGALGSEFLARVHKVVPQFDLSPLNGFVSQHQITRENWKTNDLETSLFDWKNCLSYFVRQLPYSRLTSQKFVGWLHLNRRQLKKSKFLHYLKISDETEFWERN